MSIHRLYIFAKNRDAVAAQKGYAFQQLKTLEDWIENRIANRDEVIYCDYEDDIFVKDAIKNKSTFKQIKLYSTNFSFSSEGIKKAIPHFFMLYVKGEYAFDQTEFIFETNASVVERTVKDNDADLLKEWFGNQDNLSNDLVGRIRVRVRKILDEYVNNVAEELSRKVGLKSEIQQARIVYDALKDEDIDAFIRCIKWRFEAKTQNVAVEGILSRIENLILRIPMPLDEEKLKIYVSVLVSEVYQRSIQDNPEDRKLTNALIDSLLLNTGSQEDQWYAGLVKQFVGRKVDHFFPGELQAVIGGARYCGLKVDDEKHKALWLGLLKNYFELADTPVESKRTVIYEYIFLAVGHNFLEERKESAIANDLDLVRFYVDHWEKRNNLNDLHDDIVMLEILKAQQKRHNLWISDKFLANWESSIEKYLDQEISTESNVDRQCNLLELRGHLERQKDISNPIASTKRAFEFFRKIPALLPKAQMYTLTRLYGQMDSIVKMLIQYDARPELADLIDEFMSEIESYAKETGHRHTTAHDLIERGVLYLQNENLTSALKALDLFQRAKDLWRSEYLKEGYVLALLNVSQVYSVLGMGYASKYYALLALWSTWNFSDQSLYKRLPQALGLICFCDFNNGSWMSALSDFNLYLFVKREFSEKGLELDGDEVYERTIFEVAAIAHATPLIHPAMSETIASLKEKWGFVWKEQIEPLIQSLKKEIKDMEQLKNILASKVRDLPLNDVGERRTIKFSGLDLFWNIEFDNTETMTAIAEEFVSVLQIVLCEIARSGTPVLVGKQEVNISINEGHFQKEILTASKWAVTIPKFDSSDPEEIKMHYIYLDALVRSILESLTSLSKAEFKKYYFEHLLLKENLAEKALEGTAYQRAYKRSIDASHFAKLAKQKFDAIPPGATPVIYRKYLTVPKK